MTGQHRGAGVLTVARRGCIRRVNQLEFRTILPANPAFLRVFGVTIARGAGIFFSYSPE